MRLPDILRAAAAHYGSRIAIRDDEGDFTWAQHADRVARTAGVLRAMGLGADDRFGVIMLNGFRTAELLWAGYWSGAVPVPLNWRLAPAEMRDILSDAGCGVVVVDGAFAPLLETAELSPWAPSVWFHGPRGRCRASRPRWGKRRPPRRISATKTTMP
jgi:acyl-CoA synthetase (AMP-forming)/AMP-acid ligase II